MSEMKLLIPTYNGNLFPQQVETDQIEEYGDPHVPVTAYREAGLRIVLGTHDPEEDSERPDLLIERQPNAWAIFVHPDGADPSAYIYILDDGRTFLIPEYCPASPTGLTTVHDLDQVPGLRASPEPTQRSALSERRCPPRFLPRRLADMGVIGCAIREAIAEIHHIGTKERLEPPAMEKVIDKHLSRLARPRT